MRHEHGSILILAIVTILILSIMAIAGLSVTSLENKSTHNYYTGKVAFYRGVEGVEIVRNLIQENPDADNVVLIKKTVADTLVKNSYGSTDYITGTLEDYENGTAKAIEPFVKFDPPPLPSISMDERVSVEPIIWSVPITVKYQSGGNTTYSEMFAAIYSFVKTD